MRVAGIQHVNITVADLERSTHFYQEVLGMRRAFAKGSTVWLEAGGDLLGLSQGTPPQEQPNHWGFQVDAPAQVDDWVAQLLEHDVKIEKGPYDRSDGRSVYFRDPDGYVLEIFFVDPSFLTVG